MVTVKNTLLMAGCFVLAACSLGMNDVLGRTTSDPFEEIPNVQSFYGNCSIGISWTRDEAADEYYLYRAVNDDNPRYELVYQGPLTEYWDNFELTSEKQMYLYRLGKRRGQKPFVDLYDTRGKAGLGVVSGFCRDSYEPNNSIQHATPLNTRMLFANSWFYHSNIQDGISIHDEDWYYVDIPAHCRAGIYLDDDKAIIGQDVNHFEMFVWEGGTKSLRSGMKEFIDNYQDVPVRVYFCIRPIYMTFHDWHSLTSQPDPLTNQPAGTYGAFISYKIRVAEVSPMS